MPSSCSLNCYTMLGQPQSSPSISSSPMSLAVRAGAPQPLRSLSPSSTGWPVPSQTRWLPMGSPIASSSVASAAWDAWSLVSPPLASSSRRAGGWAQSSVRFSKVSVTGRGCARQWMYCSDECLSLAARQM